MGIMENNARMSVDIAEICNSAISLTGHVSKAVSRGINNPRVHKVRKLLIIYSPDR